MARSSGKVMLWSPPNVDQMRDVAGLLLDELHAGGDIAERGRKVPDIGERQVRRIDPMLRMCAVHQHPACGPDRRGTRAGAAAVGGADIERNAGDANRGAGIMAAGAEKRRRHRIGRRSPHGAPPDSPGAAKRNTAAEMAQVQSPLGAPSANAVMERLSTMRSLIA